VVDRQRNRTRIPGPLTSLFVYGLASAVSASRISAKQHFPSDVLVAAPLVGLKECTFIASIMIRESAAAIGKVTQRLTTATNATPAILARRTSVGQLDLSSDGTSRRPRLA